MAPQEQLHLSRLCLLGQSATNTLSGVVWNTPGVEERRRIREKTPWSFGTSIEAMFCYVVE